MTIHTLVELVNYLPFKARFSGIFAIFTQKMKIFAQNRSEKARGLLKYSRETGYNRPEIARRVVKESKPRDTAYHGSEIARRVS
jgi:hypothetical protein